MVVCGGTSEYRYRGILEEFLLENEEILRWGC